MQLVSFDVFRTLGLPNTYQLKTDNFLTYQQQLQAADWVLFPEYWQINTLIYALGCRIFPSQASYLIGHNKIEMIRTFNACVPQHTPFTLIKTNEESNRELVWQTMDTPFVAKLPKSSMGNGVWLIEEQKDWQQYCAITDTLYAQEYLPIEQDLRIVIVGKKVIDSYWRIQATRGFYNNVAQGGIIDRTQPIPDCAIQLALELSQRLDINYAGFDIAMVGNHPYLLEFNRLFGTRGIIGGQAVLNRHLWDYLQEEMMPLQPTPISSAPAHKRSNRKGKLRRAA